MLLTYQRQTKHSQTVKYQYYTILFSLIVLPKFMSDSTSKSEATQLENTTYNILAALGSDADFLYDTIGTYIRDAQKANRQDLVDMWNTIKKDRQRHLQMERQALEKEAKEQKLSG
jgi:rubrerythrin